MGVRVVVKYWRHLVSFGHVALELYDENSDKKLYLSWANANHPELDRLDFGNSPIEFELPRSPVSFQELTDLVDHSAFKLSDQAVRYAFEIRQKKIDFSDLLLRHRRELCRYGKHYDFLKYNCAHAAGEVLFWLGYFDRPVQTYALRPRQIVEKLLVVLMQESVTQQRVLMNHREMSADEKIKCYIQLIIQYLELQRVKYSIKGLSQAVEAVTADMNLLQQLAFSSVSRVTDVIALTNTIQSLQLSESVSRVQSALSLVPARDRYLAQIEYSERVLNAKAQQFLRRGFKEESRVAERLAADLHHHRIACFEQRKMTVTEFKMKMLEKINQAKPILSQHRGWKRVLANLVLAIVGFGIGYLVAATCNKIVTNRFLFFARTDARQCLDLVDKGLGLSTLAKKGFSGL